MSTEGHSCGPEPCWECGEEHTCICGNCGATEAAFPPTTDEGWALVDLLKNVIENVRDEPQFTVAEHALMAAGEIQREWLAEHDAKVRAEALRESADHFKRAHGRLGGETYPSDIREYAARIEREG